jgi:hypothetical protein
MTTARDRNMAKARFVDPRTVSPNSASVMAAITLFRREMPWQE